ncbi:MAG TPA: biotin transporter BioY [Actinomycetota bacterium]|nr:biotin transporter BioY [Actinomycetota bacterium]
MTALAHALGRRTTAQSSLLTDIALIALGSAVMAGLAQLSFRLPFTPVPITGQTLGVLLVGASLGAWRGGAAMLLYLGEGAAGLPVFAEGMSGVHWLTPAAPTGGYLWGFVVAAVVIGGLAQMGWDRGLGSAIGAMLVGEVIIFSFGVPWLANLFGMPAEQALEAGLYPFVIGEVLKIMIAAGLLPAAWRLVGRDDASMSLPSFRR